MIKTTGRSIFLPRVVGWYLGLHSRCWFREIQQDGVLMVKASRNRDEHVADVEPLCFYALFNWDILKELTNLANVL